MEKLLKPGEAAAVLGVHVQTLRQYVREGSLRAVKVGRLLRIRPEDLEAYLAARVRQPSAPPPSPSGEGES